MDSCHKVEMYFLPAYLKNTSKMVADAAAVQAPPLRTAAATYGVTSSIIITVGEKEEGGKKVKKVATRGRHSTAADRPQREVSQVSRN